MQSPSQPQMQVHNSGLTRPNVSAKDSLAETGYSSFGGEDRIKKRVVKKPDGRYLIYFEKAT